MVVVVGRAALEGLYPIRCWRALVSTAGQDKAGGLLAKLKADVGGAAI